MFEDNLKFPSPTGVTYYELSYGLGMVSTILSGKLFPSPTGVNYYEKEFENSFNE